MIDDLTPAPSQHVKMLRAYVTTDSPSPAYVAVTLRVLVIVVLRMLKER